MIRVLKAVGFVLFQIVALLTLCAVGWVVIELLGEGLEALR